jgi:hypothetical protein
MAPSKNSKGKKPSKVKRVRRHDPLNLVARSTIGHVFAAYGVSVGKRARELVQLLCNGQGTTIFYNATAHTSQRRQKIVSEEVMRGAGRAANDPFLQRLPPLRLQPHVRGTRAEALTHAAPAAAITA